MSRHLPSPRRCLVLMALLVPLASCGGGRPDQGRDTPAHPSATAAAAGRTDPVRDLAVGRMTTVAGGAAELGDGGPATAAGLCSPTDVAVDRRGDIYVSHYGYECEGPGGNPVRRISAGGGHTPP